jgi:hypothetical protein
VPDRVDAVTNSPWALGPAEMLRDIHWLASLPGEAHRRAAFILIDNTIEVMLRPYLGLPAEKSFPDLVNELASTARAKMQGITKIELEYYHEIRNQLYHRSGAVTVQLRDLLAYQALANSLFRNLYGDNISLEPNFVDYLGPESRRLLKEHQDVSAALLHMRTENARLTQELALAQQQLRRSSGREKKTHSSGPRVRELDTSVYKAVLDNEPEAGVVIAIVPDSSRFVRASLRFESDWTRGEHNTVHFQRRYYKSDVVKIAVFVKDSHNLEWFIEAYNPSARNGRELRMNNVRWREGDVAIFDLRPLDV